MASSKKNIDLMKTILSNESLDAGEDDIIQMLLQERISENYIVEHEKNLTVGQRSADKLAKLAGSWGFIIFFFFIIASWITLNTVFLFNHFDIYPFILLNLILSCLAAIQAPVIMMSQNRQAQNDRLDAENDYKVNMKSEIIVEYINKKLNSIIEAQEEITKKLDTLENKNK